MKDKARVFYKSYVPADWDVSEFGEVFTFLRTFAFSRDNLTDLATRDEIRNIHYGDIHSTYQQGPLDFDIEHRIPYLVDGLIDKEAFKEDEFPSLIEGDLVIADVSEDYEGLCGTVELKNVRKRRVVGGLHTHAVRADEKRIAFGFRAHILRHSQVVREVRRVATGVSVIGVSKSNLSKIRIPLPPIVEQKAIARVLGVMDDVINKHNKLIAQMELRKKWLMQNLLTGKKRLRGFDRPWISVSLNDLFNEEFRYVTWSDSELYPLASIRRRFGGLFDRGALKGADIGVKCLKQIKTGDFLISRRQVSHGAWARVPEPFNDYCVSDEYDCLGIRQPELLNPKFWGWFCQDRRLIHKAYVSSNGVHLEKLILDLKSFLKHTVFVPPTVEEQTSIARVLCSADDELDLLSAKLGVLKTQKRWLMQQLLSGKRRIIGG